MMVETFWTIPHPQVWRGKIQGKNPTEGRYLSEEEAFSYHLYIKVITVKLFCQQLDKRRPFTWIKMPEICPLTQITKP